MKLLLTSHRLWTWTPISTNDTSRLAKNSIGTSLWLVCERGPWFFTEVFDNFWSSFSRGLTDVEIFDQEASSARRLIIVIEIRSLFRRLNFISVSRQNGSTMLTFGLEKKKGPEFSSMLKVKSVKWIPSVGWIKEQQWINRKPAIKFNLRLISRMIATRDASSAS